MSEMSPGTGPDEGINYEAAKARVDNPDAIDGLKEAFERNQRVHLERAAEYGTVEATSRNFETRVETNDSENLEVELVKDDEIIDINSILPEGYTLEEGKETHQDEANHRILVTRGSLTKRGGLLDLFHEIGHAIHYEDTYGVTDTEFKAAVLQTKAATFLARKKAGFKGKRHFQASLAPLNVLPMPEGLFTSMLPDRFKDIYYGQSARAERQAWFYALSLLRTIENQGFNVFSDFKDAADVKRYIDLALQTYEHAYEYDKKHLYRKPDKNYKPIYVHGSSNKPEPETKDPDIQ